VKEAPLTHFYVEIVFITSFDLFSVSLYLSLSVKALLEEAKERMNLKVIRLGQLFEFDSNMLSFLFDAVGGMNTCKVNEKEILSDC